MSKKSQSDNAKKGAEKRKKKSEIRKAAADAAALESALKDLVPGPIYYAEETTLIDTLCKDADPLMAGRLRAYHKTVGDPIDWPGCEKVEKVLGEVIKNQDAQIGLDQTRGRLIARKELKTAVAVVRDSWWIEAQQISQRVLQRLSTLSIDDRALVKNSIESEVRICAERAKARSLESES